MKPALSRFADICYQSQEYQGHGWGVAYRSGSTWRTYKTLTPIWEDDLSRFDTTSFLMAHARSAFLDEDIRLEHNMPFQDDRFIFTFNGELRGVRIKSDGRIGAEKAFNFIRRLDRGDTTSALARGVSAIYNRTEYVRAANIILTDGEKIYLSSSFSEDPGYFTLYYQNLDHTTMVCSQPFDDTWHAVPNHTQLVL